MNKHLDLQVPKSYTLAYIGVAVISDNEIIDVPVPAIARRGVLAIHTDGQRFFKVTHIPTGLCLIDGLDYESALLAVQDFHESLALKSKIWKATRDPQERDTLKRLRVIIGDVIEKWNKIAEGVY